MESYSIRQFAAGAGSATQGRGAELGAKAEGYALIVDDHPLYRDALIHLLGPMLGESRVLSASSAEQGLQIASNCAELQVILLDIGLPGLCGTEAISAFHRACPGAAIIMVSASEDRRVVNAALRAGARAFVSKTVAADVLADIVRCVREGGLAQPTWIAPSCETTPYEGALPGLTPQQRRILMLLLQGHSNKEIGLSMNLAEITIKKHVSAIFRALDVANRTQAVLAARRLGLGVVDDKPTTQREDV